VVVNQSKINELTAKYGIVVPRYTSYPTAPEWKHEYSQEIFESAIKASNETALGYSIYLHIPFCQEQCYYCGCNVVISPNKGIEINYLDKLKQELEYYGSLIDKSRPCLQMAWGGGTPTYLSPEQIIDLSDFIKANFNLSPQTSDYEYSIEIDPRVTTKEHLEALYQAGFNRLSMGVQDFNLQTQTAINRIQTFADTSLLVEIARDIGFKSINLDLIYGLPHQSMTSFQDTIEKIKQINPERIALFNYAHIPAIFPYQKKYIDETQLPSQDEKLRIFDRAVEEFTDFGFEFIGFDHFAKPDDGLAIAQRNRTLYRNFQGYTTFAGADLFGFGITAISDVQGVYKQNHKKMNQYYSSFKGADKFMNCTQDDRARREIIKQIMCNGFVSIDTDKYSEEINQLSPFVDDNLIEIITNQAMTDLRLTDDGRFLSRNIASCFDIYLRKSSGHKVFSKAL
jgi:oxygen-independent coproporphyrinogen-3 oxidase